MTTSSDLRRVGAVAAACVVAIAATGCGGSSPTKKDVIAQANAICFSTLSRVRAVAPPSTGSASGSALSAYFRRLEPIVDQEVAQLGKLPRPDADRALLDRYLSAVSQAGHTYRLLFAAAKRDDIPAVTRYLGELRASPVQRLARRYGLTECATAPGTATP